MAEQAHRETVCVRRAEVATPNASRYLQQLCKHFGHRVPATFDPTDGQIGFAAGDCTLHAEGDVLSLRVAGSGAAEAAELEDVVTRHLVRFAFREDLAVNWRTA
ncbi:MAG: DUF2218 domain-containing protein [Rhodospirillaceae bacterium]|nr:DUF2218 domain-containing protein [Rhodospirillaceae bacterium]